MSSIRSFILAFFLFLLPLQPVLFAQEQWDSCALEMGRIFASKYADQEIYKLDWCCDNIYRLLGEYAKAGLDVSNMNVLYLIPEAKKGTVQPLQPRDMKVQGGGWYYHVILERDGMIYDFDFQTQPIVVPLREYFSSMYEYFRLTPERVERRFLGFQKKIPSTRLLVRVIPAQDYLRDYKKEGSFGFYRNLENSYYPTFTVPEYLMQRVKK